METETTEKKREISRFSCGQRYTNCTRNCTRKIGSAVIPMLLTIINWGSIPVRVTKEQHHPFGWCCFFAIRGNRKADPNEVGTKLRMSNFEAVGDSHGAKPHLDKKKSK